MTLTTLIVSNALLAAAVVLGLVWLLGSAIRAERRSLVTRGPALHAAPEYRSSERLAA